MKKLLVGAFLGMFAVAGVAILPSTVNADSGFTTANGRSGQNLGYNAGVEGSTALQGDKLIKVVRTAINWVLGMLSLVALVIALYAGFLMMTSGGDEKKYGKGVGLLKWAGIGLAIIALSWLIVSLIFWIINGAIGGAGTSS